MAAERQSPDALLDQTNLSGAVSRIQDDPDAPDANWLTAISDNDNSICLTSFPTPTGNPTVGAGLQEFKIWVRKIGGTGTPKVRIELYENGVFLATLLADTNVTSTSGVLHSGLWNANLLGTANGSLVECRIYGTKSGGAPSARATVEVGAVEWNVDYSAGAVQYLAGVSNGIASVLGAAKASRRIAGAVACVATASGAAKVSKKLAGVVACAGATAGLIKVSRRIAGVVSGIASTAGSLTVTAAAVLLAGVVSGVASVTGAVKTSRRLAGLSVGLASVTGGVKIGRRLAGVIGGIASITGAVKLTQKLAGIASGNSQVAGLVKVSRRISGLISGVSAVSGNLTFSFVRYLAGLVSGIASVVGALRLERYYKLIFTDVPDTPKFTNIEDSLIFTNVPDSLVFANEVC